MGAAAGAVTLFERERESDAFRRMKRATCEGAGAQSVGSLAISPGEEALLVSVDANQLFSLSLVSQDQVCARSLRACQPVSALVRRIRYRCRCPTCLALCVCAVLSPLAV